MTRPVKFRLHVDHVDNVDGNVWAVRYGKVYRTAHQVELIGVRRIAGPPVRRRQPRVFLTGIGRVAVISRNGERTIVIDGTR